MASHPSLASSNHYPFSLYWRVFMTALIVFSSGFFLVMFSLDASPAPEEVILIFWLRPFIIFLACLFLYFIYATRIVVSSRGIREYQPYPFYKEFKWEEVDKVQIHESGTINLLYRNKKGAPQKTWTGVALHLSAYVNDWQKDGLIKNIQMYAPHLNWQADILTKREAVFWQRPSFLLMYFTLCICAFPVILYIDFLVVHDRSLLPLTGIVLWTWVGACFGSMYTLRSYSKWIDHQLAYHQDENITKTAISLYITPIQTWLIFLGLGYVVQLINGYQTIPVERWNISLIAQIFFGASVLLPSVFTKQRLS